jgi:DNA polymerase III delta prime subunit
MAPALITLLWSVTGNWLSTGFTAGATRIAPADVLVLHGIFLHAADQADVAHQTEFGANVVMNRLTQSNHGQLVAAACVVVAASQTGRTEELAEEILGSATSEVLGQAVSLDHRAYFCTFIDAFKAAAKERAVLDTATHRWYLLTVNDIGHETTHRLLKPLLDSEATRRLRIGNNAARQRNESLRQRIAESLRYYVRSESHQIASAALDKGHVCILSGPPGVGKTTLAHVLIAEAIDGGFHPVEIVNDIEEGWEMLAPKDDKQIFLYDDFLGQVSLDGMLSEKQGDLGNFLRRVAQEENARCILTTRDYILASGRNRYERLDRAANRPDTVISVGEYDRKQRAEILYKHLCEMDDLGPEARVDLKSRFARIVDHPSFNPRLIEFCTSPEFDGSTAGYVDRVVETLNDPQKALGRYFADVPVHSQLVMAALCTLAEQPLAMALEDASLRLWDKCGQAPRFGQFRSALHNLDGTFVRTPSGIDGVRVAFANPMIRELCLRWLVDDDLAFRCLFDSLQTYEQVEYVLKALSDSLSIDWTAPSSSRRTGFANRWRRYGATSLDVSRHYPKIGETIARLLVGQEITTTRMLDCLALKPQLRPQSEWAEQGLLFLEAASGREDIDLPATVELLLATQSLVAREVWASSVATFAQNLATSIVDLDDWEAAIEWFESGHAAQSDIPAVQSAFPSFAHRAIAEQDATADELERIAILARHFGFGDLGTDASELAAIKHEEEFAIDQHADEQMDEARLDDYSAERESAEPSEHEDLSEMFGRLDNR